MYVPRLLSATLRKAVRQFPAVLVTGPRQAGKTTFFLNEMGEKAEYVSFDDPVERNFAVTDPNGFLDRFDKKPVILDEIQYVPEILPFIKMRIDRDRKKFGKWLLTGSQQFQIMKNVTESLAGRIAILELLPFSYLEYKSRKKSPLKDVLWNGGYPEPSLAPGKRDLWLRSYIQTYVERDIRQLQNIKDLRTFEMFIALAAARHGRDFNTAVLSREAGVSLPTVKSWASVLGASYLCRFLSPYFKNYGKRVTKTPKLYFMDSALVCSITRQPDSESALAGAMGGMLFEGLLISEAVKVFTMRGNPPDLFDWRSHDGLEVDLIIRIGQKLVPVEIKLTATPTARHLEPINRFKKIAGNDAAESGLLVCRVNKKMQMPSNNIAVPWHEFPSWLMSKIK